VVVRNSLESGQGSHTVLVVQLSVAAVSTNRSVRWILARTMPA